LASQIGKSNWQVKSAAPSPVLGFGTPRDAANSFQVQYGVKLRFWSSGLPMR